VVRSKASAPYPLCRDKFDYGDKRGDYNGFFGGKFVGQFALPHQLDWETEIFADQFVGWTYNKWGINEMGDRRRAHMNQWMGVYALSAIGY